MHVRRLDLIYGKLQDALGDEHVRRLDLIYGKLQDALE